MKRISVLLFITLLSSTIVLSQTTEFNHQIGISFKASTNGFGGDIYYRPLKVLAIKGGIEYLNFRIKSETLERYVGEDLNVTIPMPSGSDMKFSTGAKIKTGALSLAVGYQPFKAFYLTAGIGKYLFSSEVSGTPTTDLILESKNIPTIGTVSPKISKEKIGIFNITAKPTNTITPYVGIGLGSFVPQNKKVSFALELGAYYIGKYVLNGTLPLGLKTENIEYGSSITQEQKNIYFERINNEVENAVSDLKIEVDNAILDINKTIESYNFYPVLKMTIGFRAFEF